MFLLHAADLCGPLLPHPLARRVARDLAREFAAQAARERAQGLPVTVSVPAPGDAAAASRLERGFIDAVVQPLFEALRLVAPSLGADCLSRVALNRAAWSAACGS